MKSFGFSQATAGLVLASTPSIGDVAVLDGGTAAHMGGGIWVIMQRDEYGATQNVVLERKDLEAMLSAS